MPSLVSEDRKSDEGSGRVMYAVFVWVEIFVGFDVFDWSYEGCVVFLCKRLILIKK